MEVDTAEGWYDVSWTLKNNDAGCDLIGELPLDGSEGMDGWVSAAAVAGHR